jgi:hypothetical protein
MKHLLLLLFVATTTLFASAQTKQVADFDGSYGVKFGWSKARVDAYITKTYSATLRQDNSSTFSAYSNVKMKGQSNNYMTASFDKDRLCVISLIIGYKKDYLDKAFKYYINWVNENYGTDDSNPGDESQKIWLTPDRKKGIQVLKQSEYIELRFTDLAAMNFLDKPAKEDIIKNIQQTLQAQVGMSYEEIGEGVFKIKSITFKPEKTGYTYSITTDLYEQGKFRFERTFTYNFPLKNAQIVPTRKYEHNMSDEKFMQFILTWPDKVVLQKIKGEGVNLDPKMQQLLYIPILESVKVSLREAFETLIAYENS